MNYKERILAAIKGERCDVLPCVPRLDLWYNANKLHGTLPQEFQHASLIEITEALDIGYHAIVPGFRDFARPEDEADRALGLFQCNSIFYTIEFNVERKITCSGDEVVTEYFTPAGVVRTKAIYTEKMKHDGVTLSHVAEYAIKSLQDFEAVGYLFEYAEIKPRYENYARMAEMIGNRGIIVAFCNPGGSPRHFIQKELMPFEFFIYESFDHPQEMRILTERVATLFDKQVRVCLESPAEMVMIGANYDSTIQSPPFFKEHITPSLVKYGAMLHQKGKFLLTHTDGENKGLLDLYTESNFDVADSICPFPMTKLTLKETRAAFRDKITIWGGIPSIAFLENTMSDYEFEKYLDEALESIDDGTRFIISIADTTPPGAKFDRIKKLIAATKGFGPVYGKDQY